MLELPNFVNLDEKDEFNRFFQYWNKASKQLLTGNNK